MQGLVACMRGLEAEPFDEPLLVVALAEVFQRFGQLLQRFEAPYPGYLLCQDTCFLGTIKGVGKISMQSVVDARCSLAFAKLALSKAP